MSHLVSFWWIRKTQVIPKYVVIYKNVGILLGGCLTCEELSGGYSQEMMGLILGYSLKVIPLRVFEVELSIVALSQDEPLSVDLTMFP